MAIEQQKACNPIQVTLFAGVKQAVGLDTCMIRTMQPIVSAEVIKRLALDHPSSAELISVSRLARDNSYLADDELVHPGDVCDLIPPVSGG